jgi:hypothetical protein
VKRWLITLVALDACLGLAAHFVKHSNVLETLTGLTSVLILMFAVFLAGDAWHSRRRAEPSLTAAETKGSRPSPEPSEQLDPPAPARPAGDREPG